MNYRHAFHAGNFADVFKHAALCRVLVYLREKPTAFRVIDTHAGAGLYDLSSAEAERAGEWREGIARLQPGRLGPTAAALLAPYLDAVLALNIRTAIRRYPGSPLLAQSLLRSQDRLIACEIEPTAAATLARTLAGDSRCKMLRLDGWMALRAQVPPKERRGLVLIDPPFEQPDEFPHLAEAVIGCYRKWPSGIFMLWYPIKDRRGPDGLAKALRRDAIAKTLRAELTVSRNDARLGGCGLLLINPPWTLEKELSVLLPALAECLSRDRSGGFDLDWLGREK